MLDCNMRKYNTIVEIETSDLYDENIDLFEKGISILKNFDCDSRIDFNDGEREVLEEIYTILDG